MRLLLIIITALFSFSTDAATPPDDSYIAGYATAILKLQFGIELPALTVRNGIVTLQADKLPAEENHARMMQLLSEIPSVTKVEIVESVTTSAPLSVVAAESEQPEAVVEKGVLTTGSTMLATGLLPEGHLFQPLLADPRWNHFSAAYRYYVGRNVDGNHNGSVSFGETIPFYRANIDQTNVQWEVGLQAGVFSDFNFGAPSTDLINTDFIGGIYFGARAGNASAFARLYHQSSHLGDEFLLRKLNEIERVNLSYEAADLRLSYELPYGTRIYVGGGGIFRKEPSSVKPWSVQYGVEFRSPWQLDFVWMRPVMAIDIKNFEQNNWRADVSARAGVQFDNFQTFNRKLQFLLEYFNGRSPTGQFYQEKVEYLGIGAHYHY